jgi:hypothetical protein
MRAPYRRIVERVAPLNPLNVGTIWGTDYWLECGHRVNNDGRQHKARFGCWKCLHSCPVDRTAAARPAAGGGRGWSVMRAWCAASWYAVRGWWWLGTVNGLWLSPLAAWRYAHTHLPAVQRFEAGE